MSHRSKPEFRTRRRRGLKAFSAHVDYLVSGKWLRGLTGIDRAVARRQKTLSRRLGSKLIPRPLKSATASIQSITRRRRQDLKHTRRLATKAIERSWLGRLSTSWSRHSKAIERKTLKLIGGALSNAWDSVIPRPLKSFLKAVTKSAKRQVVYVFGFLGTWFKSRKYAFLLAGVPACILSAPLLVCLVQLPFHGADAKAKHYRSAAAAAIGAGHHEEARLYYRKLDQLGAMNERVEFLAADGEFKQGNIESAVLRMQQLAPHDAQGFPFAHLWLAQYYLEHPHQLPVKQAHQLAEAHLGHVLDRDSGNLHARALQALLFQHTGRFDEAAKQMKLVADRAPDYGLGLARVYHQQGKHDLARQQLEKILDGYSEQRSRGKKFAEFEFLTWSSACYLAGKFDLAEEALELGVRTHPQSSKLTQQLYKHCVAMARLLHFRDEDPEQRIRILHRAWQLDPTAQDPVIMIVDLATQYESAKEFGDRVLQQMLRSETASPQLLAIWGTAQAELANYDEAARFLSEAFARHATDARSANNLAWVRLQQGGHHLGDALRSANAAVKLAPDVSIYRETRGQILLDLGRYAEAVDDLTLALNGMGDNADVHRALASAYDRLGKAGMAQAHRQRAQ